jgi:TonB family protein
VVQLAVIPLEISNRGSGVDFRSFEPASRQRFAAIGCVIAIHVAVFWALTAMHIAGPRIAVHDLQVTLFDAPVRDNHFLSPPLHWTFQAPEEALVPEPEIVIAPDEQVRGNIVAGAISQRLAPRLDPDHLNERLVPPVSLRAIANAVSLALRILVRPDGCVAEAMIGRSSGDAALDRFAANYVTANWRFLPGSVNGQPVETWTTVIVRFATS